MDTLDEALRVLLIEVVLTEGQDCILVNFIELLLLEALPLSFIHHVAELGGANHREEDF